MAQRTNGPQKERGKNMTTNSTSKLKAKDPKDVSPGKSKIMIFSRSGVGKTWFALDFPKPYYIDTEGGAKLGHYQKKLAADGGAYFGPEDGALNFEEVIGQVQALATEKHEYKTLIFDSITKLFQTAIADEANRLGDKDAFGASKKPAIAFMRRLVNWVQRIDMNVIFIAHEVAEWGMVNGQREQIGVVADIWDKLQYELDLNLQAVRRGNSRVAIVKKSRLLGFPETDTFPLEYEEFASRYGKDFIEGAVSQITLASADQVAEIKRILDLLKLPQNEIDKALNKAKAEDWSELTDEQADAYIAYLKKKIEK
jgi:hypothetical protein